MSAILVITASVVLMIWGAAHIFPTKIIVDGFGSISQDNKYLITMEWIAEGLAIIFIGALNLAVLLTGGNDTVLYMSAGMLVIMAVLSAFTGARTPVLPMKLCPVIKTIAAIMLVASIFV